MKITWTAEDIKPGRKYGKIGGNARFIIGKVVSTTDSKNLHSLCEIDMNTGHIQSLGSSASDIAEYLTKCNMAPADLLQEGGAAC